MKLIILLIALSGIPVTKAQENNQALRTFPKREVIEQPLISERLKPIKIDKPKNK
jgi:hypothetical protein